MNTKIQYVSLGVSAVFLIGIGLILDGVGGFGVRTDNVSTSVTLSVSQPVLLGVPQYARWVADDNVNIGVVMRVVSKEETRVLGEGELLDAGMAIVLPCFLVEPPFRLELLDTVTGALLGVREIDTLPPGPDCVQ